MDNPIELIVLKAQQKQKKCNLRNYLALAKAKTVQARHYFNASMNWRRKAQNLLNLFMSTTLNTRTIDAKPRRCNFFEEDVVTMNDDDFKKNFRVSRDTFTLLCLQLQSLEKQVTFYKIPVSLQKRIAISLYLLGKLITFYISFQLSQVKR